MIDIDERELQVFELNSFSIHLLKFSSFSKLALNLSFEPLSGLSEV